MEKEKNYSISIGTQRESKKIIAKESFKHNHLKLKYTLELARNPILGCKRN